MHTSVQPTFVHVYPGTRKIHHVSYVNAEKNTELLHTNASIGNKVIFVHTC